MYGEAWQAARAEGKYRLLEESWGEHGAYIRKAEELITPVLAANMDALARAVDVEGPRLVVFNPLPWRRDDVVSIEAPQLATSGLVDVASGDHVRTQVEGSTLRFLARDVPSMGYRTYVPAGTPPADQQNSDASSVSLENRFFRLRVDPSRGVIASLIDKGSGRELVDAASDYGLGQYLYERFDADDSKQYVEAFCKVKTWWAFADIGKPGLPPAPEAPRSVSSPENFRLAIRRGTVSAAARMSAAPSSDVPHGVTLEVTLYHDLPYLDLRWSMRDKKPEPWPEAGWLCFPLKLEEPSFRLARLGTVIDPARDIRRSANHEVFCLTGGMTATGPDGIGVTLCPIDAPLVSLGRLGIFRYSRQFGARKPVVFVNLHNDVWGTNFQQWNGGSWSSRVRLWAVDGNRAVSDLVSRSWETRSQTKVAVFDGPAGTLAPSEAGLELSRSGVLVTALGANPDGDGQVLRLWEQVGQSGPCRVRLPDRLHSAQVQPCDLRGRAQGKPIPVRDGSIEVPLTRFAPLSLLLRNRRETQNDSRNRTTRCNRIQDR